MKIAIASGKGGTGKTTLSTNLAVYLAEKKSVVLTDLDVEEPNSGLFIHGELIHQEDKFNMVPQWKSDSCTLCGNCREVCISMRLCSWWTRSWCFRNYATAAMPVPNCVRLVPCR